MSDIIDLDKFKSKPKKPLKARNSKVGDFKDHPEIPIELTRKSITDLAAAFLDLDLELVYELCNAYGYSYALKFNAPEVGAKTLSTLDLVPGDERIPVLAIASDCLPDMLDQIGTYLEQNIERILNRYEQ